MNCNGERRHPNWIQKYGKCLKFHLPFKTKPNDEKTISNGEAGCFSYVSLSWLNSLMWNAHKTNLTQSDLWTLSIEDGAEMNASRLEQIWEEELKNHGNEASLVRSVWKFIRRRTLISIFLILLGSLVNIITPSWLFKAIVHNLEKGDTVLWHGLIFVLAMFIAQILRIIVNTLFWIFSAHTAIRIQSALKILLFRKALKIRHKGNRVTSQMMNSIVMDTNRVFEATWRGTTSFSTIVALAFVVSYSFITIGIWSLLGVLVLICSYPATICLARKSSYVRKKAVPQTEKRIHLINEILTSICFIKMYVWEEPMILKVADVRKAEKQILQTAELIHSVSNTTAPIFCILAAVSTFLGHTLSGNPLTASQAFSVFSVFAAARFALAATTNNSKFITDALIGCRQIQALLLKSEVAVPNSIAIVKQPDLALLMEMVTLSWNDAYISSNDENSRISNDIINKEAVIEIDGGTLTSIHLSIPKGCLVGICGNVGSGKSSLLEAIIGNMNIINGVVSVAGSMAYVPQQSWMFTGSLRENILFGLPYEQQRYNAVLEACCLDSDINLLPNGDFTEIGERGINLSGGQRQRVNLARAFYSDRDIYLLDDPLSAVDLPVAKKIFQMGIKNLLKNKTIVLVTHNIVFLEHCDHLVVMENGKISEQGEISSLLTSGGQYSQIFNFVTCTNIIQKETDIQKSPSKEMQCLTFDQNSEKGKLISEEEKRQGNVSLSTYLEYIKAGGGYCVFVLVLLVFLLNLGATLFNNIWLQQWLDSGDGSQGSLFKPKSKTNEVSLNYINLNNSYKNQLFREGKAITKYPGSITENPMLDMFTVVYGTSVIALIFTGFIQFFLSNWMALTASSNLHNKMFRQVLYCPMRFFDTTPVGRILNRFSKDMDELDYTFPFQFGYVLQYTLLIFGQVILVGFIYPKCIGALIIILVCILCLESWLHAGIREIKRIEGIARSDFIITLTSVIQGLDIVRVFQKQPMFEKLFEEQVNRYQSSHLLFVLTQLWFSSRMEILCSLFVTVTGVTVILDRDNSSPALAGLALSSAFQVTQIITGLMRNKTDFQARFVAVERILEYSKMLNQETVPVKQRQKQTEDWIEEGSITFKDVNLSYRAGLPFVLNNINFHIKGGEKIGIVGRTGAGKSSLIGALLRLVEIDSGFIFIDDVNIRHINLQQLRSAISIIPQEPVLFQGTIRYNLDPFNEHTDEEIWNALGKSYLHEKIVNMPQQLLAIVHSNGENFSVGEKQLLCLARTILRKNKILLLDEATAFVDVETDHKIQQTIRLSFQDCTILTIAHRLNTIWDCDRILVISAGKVVQFDSIDKLMEDKDSYFHHMMSAIS